MKFDAERAKQIVLSLIPDGFEQKRMINGRYVITTKWKGGMLRWAAIDGTDISHKTNTMLKDIAKKIFELLMMVKKWESDYTGKRELTVELKESRVKTIYLDRGNFIIK